MRFILLIVSAFVAISAQKNFLGPGTDDLIDWSSYIRRSYDSLSPSRQRLAVNKNGRVAGGQEVEPHSYPYQTGLFLISRDDHGLLTVSFCGSSIINQRTILTAAWCTRGILQVTVVAGAHNIDANEIETQQRILSIPADNFRVHPLYQGPPVSNANDIATLLIPPTFSALTWTPYVSPVAFPRGDLQTELFVGQIGRTLGWGATKTSSRSHLLLFVDDEIIDNAACAAFYGNDLINSNKICTSIATTGPCGGDNGGILGVRLQDRFVQVGVVSVTGRCGDLEPSVFERITGHLEWIDENTAVV